MTLKQIISGYQYVLDTASKETLDDQLTDYIVALEPQQVMQLLDFAKKYFDGVQEAEKFLRS